MAEYSRFFGGLEGEEPEYTQPQFAEVLARLFSNGVFLDVVDELEVTKDTDSSIKVGAGEGWINGFWYQNTADLVKSLGAPDPINPRIDRIVLKLDTIVGLKISCEILEGEAAEVPVPHELATGYEGIWEISLAQVMIAAGEWVVIEDEDITDERIYAAVNNTTSWNGWIPASTFTRASATTITVASGAESIYKVNDKIKFTQSTGGVKFAYITIVADTLLTINLSGLYTLENEAITAPYYSHIENPLGFPVLAKSKAIKAIRDLSASGDPTDVVYTGVGFTPTSIICISSINNTINSVISVCDSSKKGMILYHDYTTYYGAADTCFLYFLPAVNVSQTAIVKSYDADGFTLTWTKTGSPVGTATLIFLCFR